MTATVVTPTIRRKTSAEAESQNSVENLCTQVGLIFRNVGLPASRSKISRLVRDYKNRVESHGFALIDFLVNRVQMTELQRRVVDDELRKVIAYSDPTGDAAVANVKRERGF